MDDRRTGSSGRLDSNLDMKTVRGTYRFASSVGKGSCAIVYKGISVGANNKSVPQGEVVAIKTVLHGVQSALANASSLTTSSSRQSLDEVKKRKGSGVTPSNSFEEEPDDKPNKINRKRKGGSSTKKPGLFGSFLSKAASLASSSSRNKRGGSHLNLDDIERGPEMEPEDQVKAEVRKKQKAEAAELAAQLMTECEAGRFRRPPDIPISGSPDCQDDSKMNRYVSPLEFRIIRRHMSEAYGVSPSRVCTRMRKEISIHQAVKHPHVTTLYDSHMEIDKTHLILEYCEESLYGFVLRARPDGLNLNESLLLTSRLGSALAYLHDNGIAHRDVKLENVLLKQCGNVAELRLCDFGLATTYNDWARLPGENRRSRTIDSKTAEEFLETLWHQDKDFEDHYDGLQREYCGSPRYAAPEIIRQNPYRGPEIDDWSFGVVVAVASTCRMVPLAVDVPHLFKFLIGDEPVMLPNFVYPMLKVPLDALFQKDPLKRTTCRKVSDWADACIAIGTDVPFVDS